MRDFPAALKAALQSGTTTLCHCWRITRADGQVMGFTDHDHDLAFDGTTFRAASGFTGSDAERRLGLAAADTEITGALSSDAITEADIAAGKYDGAEIEVWLVDWRNAADPNARALLRAGQLGRVRRGEMHFEAEVRTLASRLQQVRGRTFAHGCDAELGDARCGVDLSAPAWNGTGIIVAVHDATLRIDGLGAFAADFFTHGTCRITSGAAAGFAARIIGHRLQGGTAIITLADTPPDVLASGDAAHLVAGCDRAFATCRDKFANAVNFRGFPHMPGNDFAISYPVPGDDGLDGSSMNR